MAKTKLSKSTRKYIRKEKARIRREVSVAGEKKKLIEQLYQKFMPRQKKKAEKGGKAKKSKLAEEPVF